ncbi:AroM family protein [Shimwellia pseudoproteus]|uniref:AroM family protein n=1 Tax=Shimwellia pseudoproteus TaxID=570012 RepID=UPI0018EB9C8E|nr:AroM family protein [Shimwellia pseudoproteus]MBJ3814764.1 AroM family protein [Shimwellia pseudoproteus]
MNTELAILTIGAIPVGDIKNMLTEQLTEHQFRHICLLSGMSRQQVEQEYGYQPGDTPLFTLLEDKQTICLSRARVEDALTTIVQLLERQGVSVILLLSSSRFESLTVRDAMLLESERIIPPLVASIVEGHQVGVVVPAQELLQQQRLKWQGLDNSPLFTLANPLSEDDDSVLDAGRELVNRGADVIVLDSAGYRLKHRDLLQKALDVPVLLSASLLTRLASELVV